MRRSIELTELDIALLFQKTKLEELMEKKVVFRDKKAIKKDFSYYKVTLDSDTKTLKSYEVDEKKVAKARSFSGFFSIMTHKVDFSAMKTFNTYRLRDE
jgi:hypothetical protein